MFIVSVYPYYVKCLSLILKSNMLNIQYILSMYAFCVLKFPVNIVIRRCITKLSYCLNVASIRRIIFYVTRSKKKQIILS